MPIAHMTDILLHAGSGAGSKLIEPIKKNQYRLRLHVSDLINVLKAQFAEDSAYLETVKTVMTGDVLPIEVTFVPPAVQVEQRKIRGKGNVEVKYSGYINYGNAEATFHNFIDLDTYKFFYRWASIPGALFLQRNDDKIEAQIPDDAMAVPDFSTDGYAGYKVNATLSTYHTLDTAAGDETENTRWILEGVFPVSVSAGDFNHADDGEAVLTNVSFSIDLCLPAKL